MIYPWQQMHFQQLWSALREERLAHAYLFSGVAGIGKFEFAKHFTQAVLCETKNNHPMACDSCHACRLVQSHAHPDYLLVVPEQEGHAIKVDQIRAINEFAHHSSVRGKYRVILIYPAQQMNANAANALLKTLEEPATGAIIILVTDQYGLLPATIRSRCQHLIFPLPALTQALVWLEQNVKTEESHQQLLKIASGAPLRAADLAKQSVEQLSWRKTLFSGLTAITEQKQNPVQVASTLPAEEIITLLAFFTSWVVDVLRLQLCDNAPIVNDDYLSSLRQSAANGLPAAYLSLMKQIEYIYKQMNNGVNFNKLLLLESLLIRFRECI